MKKSLSIFILILYFISNVKFIYSNSNLTKTEVLKKETKLNFNFNLKIQNKMNTNSLKKSDKDILWEGWIKYIKLKNVSNVKKPSNFFINDQFYNQRVYKSEIDLKDELGSFKYIPSKFFFYAKLSNHTFNIISSKESQISSNFDSIIISNIKQIPLEKKLRYEGGINILGDFNEGYCFQVITDKEVVLKVAIDVTYVICTNSSKDRDYLVEKMIDLKILDQNNGEIINVNETPKNSLSDDENLSRGKIFSPKDGRWILLKNWSQCSLKCGGGQQFQQWMCIQPRPGGKPCVGSPILTRECNINPCPKYGISKKESNFEEEIELKPIIETRPFSQRKQQRILCKIRETDVMFNLQNLNGVEQNISVPARLIMNKHTISLFQDDSYTKSAFNFPIDKVIMEISNKNHCCIYISNTFGGKTFNICGGFGTKCGTASNPIFSKEWIDDLNFFKNKCNSVTHVEKIDNNQEIEAEEEASQMKMDIINSKSEFLNKKLDQKKEEIVLENVKKTQDNAVKVLKKEFNIEELLAKEEQQKALKETQELLEIKKHEISKKECLEKALKVKENQEKKKTEAQIMQQNVNLLKSDTKTEIAEQRDQLKERINNIRKRNKQRIKQIKKEISIIRSEMAEGLMAADKLDKYDICFQNSNDNKFREEYCNENFTLSVIVNTECKDPERFCYSCCENQIGSIHLKERENCNLSCSKLF